MWVGLVQNSLATTKDVMSSMWVGLVQNIPALIVGGVLSKLLSWWRSSGHIRRFKEVFGPNVGEANFSLVYDPVKKPEGFTCPPASGSNERRCSSEWVRQVLATNPVPECTWRSMNYLASAIGKHARATPTIRSDKETLPNLDMDFVSIGGSPANSKSKECEKNGGNKLAAFDDKEPYRIIRLSDRSPLVEYKSDLDYGLILKIHPSQFPKRVWIMCAGRGEWGTSAAAWFLANKWGEIQKEYGSHLFAIVIQVKPGQDESAEVIAAIPKPARRRSAWRTL